VIGDGVWVGVGNRGWVWCEVGWGFGKGRDIRVRGRVAGVTWWG
jgi:hypothetical protein